MVGSCYMLSHKRTIRSNPGDTLPLGCGLISTSRERCPVTDDHIIDGEASACCGGCQNGVNPRPRLVIGVFNDANSASGVATKLRGSARSVCVLSNGEPLLAQDFGGLSPLSLMGCGRLYQQVAAQLESGASIVVVDALSPEQQLGFSRVLLESKCDLLLTHDGSGPNHHD